MNCQITLLTACTDAAERTQLVRQASTLTLQQLLADLRLVPELRGERVAVVAELVARGELLTPQAARDTAAAMLRGC